MNLDLPKVSRTTRSTGVMYWLGFVAAANELTSASPGVDQREIEQALFEGWPFVAGDYIYVPQTIIVHLLVSAVRRGLIEQPAGLPEELWEPLGEYLWEPA